MIHPTNRLERLKIKKKKDERKAASKVPEDKTARVWRKRTKEEIKARETEDELHRANDYLDYLTFLSGTVSDRGVSPSS